MNSRTFFLVAACSGAAVPGVADNEVVNPGFVTNLSGWTVLVDPAFMATHDPAQSFNSPGSLRVATPAATAATFTVVQQCRTVTPGQVLDYGGKYRFESGHAANLKGGGSVSWFTDSVCGAPAGTGPSTNGVSDLADTWLPIHANDVTVPAGMNSALFRLGIAVVAGEGVGWFDDVYFGPDPLVPVELIGATVE